MTTLSSCDTLLEAIGHGFKDHLPALAGVHVVVFFDWCRALADNGNSQLSDFWHDDHNFDAFDDVDNLTVLGWTTGATVTEGSKQMAWLGTYHDLVRDDALNTLTSGSAASLRRLTVKRGIMDGEPTLFPTRKKT